MSYVFFLVCVLTFIYAEIKTYKWFRFMAPKVLDDIWPIPTFIFVQIISLIFVLLIIAILGMFGVFK